MGKCLKFTNGMDDELKYDAGEVPKGAFTLNFSLYIGETINIYQKEGVTEEYKEDSVKNG